MNGHASGLEFHYEFYDLYSSDLSDLRSSLADAANRILPDLLSGPLNAWVFEMAVNALKATYKKVYRTTFLQPIGLHDIAYEQWLQLFKTEIEEHSAENFAHYCRENNLFVEVSGRFIGNLFRVEVSNEGVPSQEEWERIQIYLQRAKEMENLDFLFEDEEDPEESRKEGGGIGLSLILMGLRGLGYDPGQFQLLVEDGRTVSRIDLPVRNQENPAQESVVILDESQRRDLFFKIHQQNSCSIACFDKDGNLISVSPDLLMGLGYTDSPQQAEEFKRTIPEKFLNEIFHGSRGVRTARRFNNYRIFIPTRDGSDRVLYNISGHLDANDSINTLWQEVVRGDKHGLSEGSFSGNFQLYSIVEPYIPSLILKKAKEVLSVGQNRIPDEVVDRTIVFADLAGFTRQAEITEPRALIELLNLVFGVMVKSIRRSGGHVEKFMGDAVLATFPDPLDAVVASVEIQNQFYQLNRYRKISGHVPIRLRIGINSGLVVMGNIGTGDSRDWTPLGDVVNTASRIEKGGEPGCVHISESTYRRIKDRVSVDQELSLQAKGKENEVRVFSVGSVSFSMDSIPMTMKLRNEDLVEEPDLMIR